MPNASSVSAAEAAALFADLIDTKAIILAVSGGPDSTALMVLAARWRKALKRGPVLIAVTVDHGLRKESKREALDVAHLAKRLGIAHRILRWTGTKPKTGLPQAARHARYRLLANAARKAGASHVLTAHTLDDQAETVIIRLLRGSGLTGLAAMQRTSSLSFPSPERGGSTRGARRGGGNGKTPTRTASLSDLPLAGGGEEETVEGITLLRPLLDIPKVRLIATLQADKIAFADDPTNRDPQFTRARLRGLMPQLAAEGLDAARLALLARRLGRAEAALKAGVDQAAGLLHISQGEREQSCAWIGAADFSRLSVEIALRLLGRAIDAIGTEGPVELGKLESLKEALDSALKTGTAFRRSLAGAIVTLSKAQITVERAPARRNAPVQAGRKVLIKPLTKARPGRAKRPKAR